METLTINNEIRFNKFDIFCNKINKFYYSNYYLSIITLIAFIFWATHLSIVSTSLLLLIGSIVIITNKDVSPFLPILVLMVITVSDIHYLEKQQNLILMAVFGTILGLSLLFHIFYYKQKLAKGKLTISLLLISIACLFGGIGYTNADAFGTSILYVITLGIAMFALYLFMISCIELPNNIDTKRYICKLILTISFTITMQVFIAHTWIIGDISDHLRAALEVGWGNRSGMGIMLVMTLPIGFYLAETAKKYNTIFFILSFVQYVFLMITFCRGSMLFGTIEMIAITIYLLMKSNHKKPFIFALSISAITCIIVLLVNIPLVEDFFNKIFSQTDFSTGRIKLYKESLIAFMANPLFGVGFGYGGELIPNGPNYHVAENCMYWFHSTPLQALASLGLFGFVCYAIYYYKKTKLLFDNKDMFNYMLAFGIIFYELQCLIDAGSFQPFPFVFTALMITTFIEKTNKLSIN